MVVYDLRVFTKEDPTTGWSRRYLAQLTMQGRPCAVVAEWFGFTEQEAIKGLPNLPYTRVYQ